MIRTRPRTSQNESSLRNSACANTCSHEPDFLKRRMKSLTAPTATTLFGERNVDSYSVEQPLRTVSPFGFSLKTIEEVASARLVL
jgi:hypothetical protein